LLEEDQAFYEADSQTRSLMGETDFSLWQSKAAADTERRVDWLCSVLQTEGEKVLDVGCGYGFFVDAAIKAGHQAVGLDVSGERLALAKKNNLHGGFIQGEMNESFVKEHCKQFKAVTLFHVLEHLKTPVSFLQQCFELLAPGGLMLVEVPNLGDEFLDQGEYRAFYWQRAHLSYFNAARLELALRRAGFNDFSVRGVQRYGLRNLLHWSDEGKPQLTAPIFRETHPLLVRVEQLYQADRERALTSDTLIAEVRKGYLT
jgi:2-polyprenyl-3-methyl-5-hydroxy-6-metoxy-1,4-benzoquinol methylase